MESETKVTTELQDAIRSLERELEKLQGAVSEKKRELRQHRKALKALTGDRISN